LSCEASAWLTTIIRASPAVLLFKQLVGGEEIKAQAGLPKAQASHIPSPS